MNEFSFVPWVRNGHLQTVMGHFLPIAPHLKPWKPMRLRLSDGEILAGREFFFDPTSVKPLLIFFHGLTGDADSKYMLDAVRVAESMTHDAVLMNHRGAGEGEKLARTIYHNGVGRDLSEVVGYYREKFPDRPIICSGFSLSGNLILNLMAHQCGENLPDGAIAVNPAMHLPSISKHITRGLNKMYEVKFVLAMRKIFRDRERAGLIRLPNPIPKSYRLRDIDDAITAPLAGFKSAEDYYEKCSSYPWVHLIDRPTVVLHAEDDPFIPAADFRSANWSNKVKVKIVPHGGHIGYLGKGERGRARRMLMSALLAALKSI